MPLKRLKQKTTKENLWLYILTLLKEKPRYAYELKKEIKDRFNFSVGRITSYMVLYKLEKKGYVSAKWESGKKRPRKYYTITAKGGEILKEGKQYLKELLTQFK